MTSLLPLLLLAGAFAQGGAPPPDDPSWNGAQVPAPALAPPVLLESARAIYPLGLDQGEVKVELNLLVDEQGAVERVDVLEGAEPFASLAVSAVTRFRFQPASEGGRPTAVELPFTYVFPEPPVNVSGVVRVRGTGAPAAGIQVAVGERILQTDPEGRFAFRNVAPGEVLLTVTDAMLVLDPVRLMVVGGEAQDLELYASPRGPVGEIVGLYERQRMPVIRRSLTAEEIRTTPGTLGDPVRAVANLPGVVRTPLDAGWLLVRGGDPEDTGLYLDGIRVPLVFHLLGLASVIHPAFVDRVDFTPGSYDVKYGRATGGAVNLVSLPAPLGDPQVQVGADLIGAGAFTRTRLGKKGGFAAAFRRSYLDTVLGAVAGAGLFGLSEGAEQIAPRYWDWQARYDRRRWGVLALGYGDLFFAPTTDGSTLEMRIGTERVHGKADVRVGERTLRLSPILGVDEYSLSYTDYDDQRERYVYGGRAEVVDDGEGEWGWSAGVDSEMGWYDISVQSEYDTRPISAGAAYASLDPYTDVRMGERSLVVVGARLETLFVEGQLPRAMPSPRFHGRFPTEIPDLDVVTGAGIYHQWPSLDEIVALPGGFDLKLERSWGADMGATWGRDRHQVETDLYGRKLENVTLVEEDGTLGQGSGLAYGWETLYRWQAEPLEGWVSYTFSRSLRQEEPGNPYRPHTWDQPHYLVAVATWALPQQWALSGRFRVGSGYPHDPDESSAYDLLYQRGRCLSDPAVDPDLAWCTPYDKDRLPAFYALDLKASRRFLFRKWTLDAWLDLQNATNRRIPEPVIADTLQVETAYSYGLPILPVFGVKGVFRP